MMKKEKVNNMFSQCSKSIAGSTKDFIHFVNINNPCIKEEDLNDIDLLARRVALNMFVYPENIETAKSDYITLIALLMKKGAIFDLESKTADIDQKK